MSNTRITVIPGDHVYYPRIELSLSCSKMDIEKACAVLKSTEVPCHYDNNYTIILTKHKNLSISSLLTYAAVLMRDIEDREAARKKKTEVYSLEQSIKAMERELQETKEKLAQIKR